MRRVWVALVAGLLLVLLAAVSSASARVDASARTAAAAANDTAPQKHNLTHPLGIEQAHSTRRRSRRRCAAGEREGVPHAESGKYIELVREKTDRVFVVIAEFGNTRHAAFARRHDSGRGRRRATRSTYDGPEHNKIPQPNRAVDNSTLWQADYNTAHYDEHVLQPDGEVLRAAVVRPLLGRRRRHRVGEGAVQRGALRP